MSWRREASRWVGELGLIDDYECLCSCAGVLRADMFAVLSKRIDLKVSWTGGVRPGAVAMRYVPESRSMALEATKVVAA